MLLEFSVENFASISKSQSIDLRTGKTRGKSAHLLKAGKQSVLKFSSIYGANAAGKSNLIKALHFGKKVIAHGCLDKQHMSPHRASAEWLEKPSTFIYKIHVSKKTYEYGFTLSWKNEYILEEWLIEQHPRFGERPIFHRGFENSIHVFNISSKLPEIDQRIKVYFHDALEDDNTLFLYNLNSKKDTLYATDPSLSYLRDIFQWFTTKLKFVYPNNNSDLGKYSFLTYTETNQDLFDCLAALNSTISELTFIDITSDQVFQGLPQPMITDIEADIKQFVERIKNENTTSESIFLRLEDSYYIISIGADAPIKIQTIQFTHGPYGIFEFREESDGTKRLLELLEILTSPEKDVTYIVDEIDRSLHPLLTEQFISMYLHPDTPNRNQLIITTHESRLLNLKKLRKDEIYFATNKHGSSTFVRFDEFEQAESRYDLDIERSYLRGRYGGIPHLIKTEDG